MLIMDKNPYNHPHDISIYHKIFFLRIIKRVFTFFKIRKAFEVFHFNAGSTLLHQRNVGLNYPDLPYYKGKRIMTFNGSDARGLAFEQYNDKISKYLDDVTYGNKKNQYSSIEIKKRNKLLLKYLDHIFYVNPDLGRYLPKNSSFIPYAIIDKIHSEKKYNKDDKFRIMHAPTNRDIKGTKFIIQAVKKMEKKFPEIEFELIENITHEKALKKIACADLFIDQLLIGWYGAVTAEAMLMGVSVAVFIREEDLDFIPQEMASDLKNSVINVNQFNIEKVISYFIKNKKVLKEKSKKGLKYVKKWHDPKYVSSQVLNKYHELLNK